MTDTNPADARHVLIISRAYYPHGSPGSHRVAGLAKHLPEFGWTPVVLCPDWTPQNCFDRFDPSLTGRDPCEVVRVPYELGGRRTITGLFQRAANWLGRCVSPHIESAALMAVLAERARALLAERSFDAILASAPPTMTLTVAGWASEQSGVRWVADLRDLVGGSQPGRQSFKVRRHANHHREICRSAAALVTVSEPLGDQLRPDYPGKPIEVVANGYDPDNYAADVEPDRDAFTIVYCGEIMSTESPALLFDALDHILRTQPERLARFRLRFYGATPPKVTRHLKGRPCAPLVEIHRRVSFNESIRAQQRAAALLVLSCPGTKGILTSKVFEYLGARRPVLSVPGDGGAIDALLEETQGGRVGRSADEIAGILLGWIAEWQGQGGPAWRARPEAVERCTRRHQAARMARALDNVTGAKA